MGLSVNAYHYMENRKLSDNKEFRLLMDNSKLSSNKMYHHDDRTLSEEAYSHNNSLSIKDILQYAHTMALASGNDVIDGITAALRYGPVSGMNHSLNEISKMSQALKGGTIRKRLRVSQRISRLGLLYNPYGLID